MIVFIILLAVFLFLAFLVIKVRLIIEKKSEQDLMVQIKIWFFKYTFDLQKMLKKDKTRKKAAFEIKINSEFIKYLLSKTRFIIAKLNLYIGFDDAAQLALLCGFLQALIYTAVPLIKNADLKDINSVSVSPVFNKNFFELQLECIIKVKFRNIIIGYIFKKRK